MFRFSSIQPYTFANLQEQAVSSYSLFLSPPLSSSITTSFRYTPETKVV